MGFFDGLAKTVAGAAGALTGTSAVLGTVGSVIEGVSSGQRSIASPCPGTPAGLADAVTARLNADPTLADGLRQFITAAPPPDQDFRQLQSVWGTPAGLATGAVWTAWGGGDCKVGSRETPLQNELLRISRLPLPGGSLPNLSITGAGTDGTNSTALLGIVVLVAVAIGGFLLLRKRR